MSDDASEVKRLLAPLRDRPVSVAPVRLAARRERVVSALQREVQELSAERASRPRRRARVAALLLTAAAVGVALVGTRLFVTHSAGGQAGSLTFVGSVGDTVARGSSSTRHLRSGDQLNRDPGEIESAEQGSAELVSSAGLGLHLGGGTRLSLSGLVGSGGRNQVELRQGSLVCTVPHLSEGQHFSVATPDARVVVHGTVFTVQVDPQQNAGQRTCVRVTDGVVIVQHGNLETALNAGDSWGCNEASGEEPSGVSRAAQPGTDGEADSNRAELHKAAPHTNERGTLGDENRLFQAALAAERQGQKAKAEQTLNRLLTKYPSSPLASEARRALSRVAVAGAGGEK
jgi:hypothetical protein